MKLKKAAQTTATRGLRTRVDTTVAMELAASWKPFMKSKARATRTMRGPSHPGSKNLTVSLSSQAGPQTRISPPSGYLICPRGAGRQGTSARESHPDGSAAPEGHSQYGPPPSGEAPGFHRTVWTFRRGLHPRLPRPVRTPTGLSDTG